MIIFNWVFSFNSFFGIIKSNFLSFVYSIIKFSFIESKFILYFLDFIISLKKLRIASNCKNLKSSSFSERNSLEKRPVYSLLFFPSWTDICKQLLPLGLTSLITQLPIVIIIAVANKLVENFGYETLASNGKAME